MSDSNSDDSIPQIGLIKQLSTNTQYQEQIAMLMEYKKQAEILRTQLAQKDNELKAMTRKYEAAVLQNQMLLKQNSDVNNQNMHLRRASMVSLVDNNQLPNAITPKLSPKLSHGNSNIIQIVDRRESMFNYPNNNQPYIDNMNRQQSLFSNDYSEGNIPDNTSEYSLPAMKSTSLSFKRSTSMYDMEKQLKNKIKQLEKEVETLETENEKLKKKNKKLKKKNKKNFDTKKFMKNKHKIDGDSSDDVFDESNSHIVKRCWNSLW